MQHSITNWHVDRARTEEWEPIWDELQQLARQADGFIGTQLLRSVEHPGKYTVYALWESRSQWEAYYELPRVRELMRATFRLLKGPPVQEWFDLVREIAQASSGIRA